MLIVIDNDGSDERNLVVLVVTFYISISISIDLVVVSLCVHITIVCIVAGLNTRMI
jgi:hypothetical protein